MSISHPLARAVCFTLLLCCVVFSACGERKADLDNPNHYSAHGMAFDYPGNWKVTDDQDMGGGVYFITIESPGNALVMVHRMPDLVALDIRAFGEELAKNTQKEMPIGEASPSRFGAVKTLGMYEAMKEEFVISLLNQRVPHLRTYYRRVDSGVSWYITTQVSKEDVKAVQKGFELVVRSFRIQSG